MIRQPVVAGKFYNFNKDNLVKQIKNCFTGKFGPGKIKKKNQKN